MLYSGGSRLPQQEVGSGTPVIKNIHYENIRCDYAKRNVIQVIGLPEMPVRNISFKYLQINGNLGIDINDAKNIILENLTISNHTGAPASISFSDSIAINKLAIAGTAKEQPPIRLHDVSNIQVAQLHYDAQGEAITISGKATNLKFDKSIPKQKVAWKTN